MDTKKQQTRKHVILEQRISKNWAHSNQVLGKASGKLPVQISFDYLGVQIT